MIGIESPQLFNALFGSVVATEGPTCTGRYCNYAMIVQNMLDLIEVFLIAGIDKCIKMFAHNACLNEIRLCGVLDGLIGFSKRLRHIL